MLKREVVEDIVVLLRGFFATPIISSLGRMGTLEKMRTLKHFSVEDISSGLNKKLFTDSLRYLVRLGLLENVNATTFQVTELGTEVFRRANSFYVPHSYYDYMYRYHEMIQDQQGRVRPSVERVENVIGSGITHLRYFPPAVSFLKRKVAFDTLADIGCGDGQFLSTFLKEVSGKKIVGIDLSEISTQTTQENLKREYPGLELKTFCCDALDVAKWSAEVLHTAQGGRVALSMWFLLHEISSGKPQVLIDFFREVYLAFPESPIVVGEVVRQSEDILLNNNNRSLLAEYLFFHEISGQGILSWEEYKAVLANTDYELAVEKLFDEALDKTGIKIPSTFVWCLVPKRRTLR